VAARIIEPVSLRVLEEDPQPTRGTKNVIQVTLIVHSCASFHQPSPEQRLLLTSAQLHCALMPRLARLEFILPATVAYRC